MEVFAEEPLLEEETRASTRRNRVYIKLWCLNLCSSYFSLVDVFISQVESGYVCRCPSHVKAHHRLEHTRISFRLLTTVGLLSSLALSRSRRIAYHASSWSTQNRFRSCEFVKRCKAAIALHKEYLNRFQQVIVKSFHEPLQIAEDVRIEVCIHTASLPPLH